MNDLFFVEALGLNFRSAPSSANRQNIITVLQMGHEVEKLGFHDPSKNWMKVRTVKSGKVLTGYVSAKFLKPKPGLPEEPSEHELKAVHLRENNIRATRQVREAGWAFPLGEPNRPARDMTSMEARKLSLHNIIQWLDVERSPRYRPGNNTYCNIYAYDYCYLADAYLPRVWWREKALVDLLNQKEVPVKYGKTVSELNANGLFDWLEDFSDNFGWDRLFDLDELQDAANQGKVCVISAKNKMPNQSGHICLVVPENNLHYADRDEVRKVIYPLQSQAGRSNRQYFTSFGNTNWWTKSIFQDFGFWIHD